MEFIAEFKDVPLAMVGHKEDRGMRFGMVAPAGTAIRWLPCYLGDGGWWVVTIFVKNPVPDLEGKGTLKITRRTGLDYVLTAFDSTLVWVDPSKDDPSLTELTFKVGACEWDVRYVR